VGWTTKAVRGSGANRSAPVLGRSSVGSPARDELAHPTGPFHIAAPEDGRTPGRRIAVLMTTTLPARL
jgi:hypothetical protein